MEEAVIIKNKFNPFFSVKVNTGMPNNKIALIVNSLDAYKILWKPHFYFLEKYWSDCPFKIYLFAENPDYEGIEGLARDEGYWSNAYKKALCSIKEKYIFWDDESGMLIKKVYTELVMELFEIMIKENLVAINANALPRNIYKPRFEGAKPYENLASMRGDGYCVNLQPGFWNKEALLILLGDNETIWDTEINGSIRASGIDHLIAAPKTEKLVEVIDVTVDGKISKDGAKYLQKNGFNIKEGLVLKKIIRHPNKLLNEQ